MTTVVKPESETTQPPATDACWELLERVVASRHLKRATRLQELLLYIGRRAIKDGCDRLHEQEIGSSVFHRPDSYDTSFDNIVRTSVSDLRRRIEAYFSSEGSQEPLVMEIPRGSYIPLFRLRTPQSEGPVKAEEQKDHQTPEASHASLGARTKAAHWLPLALGSAGFLIIVLAIVYVYLGDRDRSPIDSAYPWQRESSVNAFWSGIVNANHTTDIVTSDTAIGLVEAISQKRFSLNDYITRSYVRELDTTNMTPEMHSVLDRILSWNLANPDEFLLARRILALDPPGKQIHLYNARNYMPDLVKRDNMILIGARKSNPWDELFDDRMNFITDFDSPRVINRAPGPGERPNYPNTDSVGYCVVAFMPKVDQSGVVLLIEGTNAEATEAAGDFLLSEDQLAHFKNLLHVAKLPYFQVLLKVSSVRGTPLNATIEAYRTFSASH